MWDESVSGSFSADATQSNSSSSPYSPTKTHSWGRSSAVTETTQGKIVVRVNNGGLNEADIDVLGSTDDNT